MTTETELLWRLAERAGVARTYRDAFGVGFDPGEESIRAVLSGLGFSIDSQPQLEESLAAVEARQSAFIPGLISCISDQPSRIVLHQPSDRLPEERVTWRTILETGKVFEGIALVSYQNGQGSFDLPPCPIGYHQLFVEGSHRNGKALLIAAPPRCYMQPEFVEGAHGFGLAAQVYGLRSDCDFGMGDLSSVASLAAKSARYGADFLGLSPLHALFTADRTKFSPYSPSSRLFIDPIYIDPCAAAAFEASGAKDYLNHPDQVHVLGELRSAPLVDHTSIWTMKRQVLNQLWRYFTQNPNPEFGAFRRAGGEALELHATFESLSHRFRDEGLMWLGEWPQDFRDANSATVRQYREDRASDIAFHGWLQWLADQQLAGAQANARAGGMKLGLYRDLAVGADRGGSEVWAAPHRFATRLSVGAPPDPLGPQGQDWGLPPLHPLTLESDGLAGFRALVAANMRHAGALRIDHAFQLQRLFVIPLGMPARLGTYVSYPFEAMLAVLRLESHRAEALVIAEDLGTAPENFSDSIMNAGILSYRVMPFEREANGTFKRPGTYPTDAIATFSTHDLPTFAGWWKGVDIGLREQSGIYDAQTVAAERALRDEDIRQFCASLAAEGLLPSADVPAEPPFDEAMRYLARTQCRLVAVQCEDVAAEVNQANVPGRDFGHPNWRRKLSQPISDLMKAKGPFARVAALIKTERAKVTQAAKAETQSAVAADLSLRQIFLKDKGAVMRKKKFKDKDRAALAESDFTLPTGECRVVIEYVEPDVDGGRHKPKRVVGDRVDVTAQIFTDGHEKIAADVLYRGVDETAWRRAPMLPLGNDLWGGSFSISTMVDYEFTVEAWRDPFASLSDGMKKKRAAGQNLRIEALEAVALIDQAQSDDTELRAARQSLLNDIAGVEDGAPQKLDRLLSDETIKLMAQIGPRRNVSRYDRDIELRIERRRANFSSWYELFPRSITDSPSRHGTFRDVIAHLPYVHELGFDVLYFPPIHPIGETNRKGRNNTLTPSEDDPGSVYAVGSEAGGHDAIHPQLGMIEDFRALVRAARDYDIEIALDFAIQCAPDHPWIRQHPEWFAWRPDGTIQYAENPPKKYEDIVNVDFYDGGLPSLWLALKDIIVFWVREGVRIFRVDNPHTKPVPFWEWLIAEINRDDPDVIFLAEAFTRPGMMKKLAKVGFQQSYTYFTWRNTKQEIISYMEELTGEMANYYRPNFFVNTPDISPIYLQTSGRAGYIVRATLASTLSSNWGLYSGFELCEGRSLPGKEEYADSEKYEIRPWDYDRPGNIRDYVATLNKIRRENPALHDFRHCIFLNAWNDTVLAYGRFTQDRSNFVMVIVNLDPHNRQDCTYEVPLWEFGLTDTASIEVEDLLNGYRFTLYGKTHQIALDPAERSAVIWRLSLPALEVPRG